MDSKLLPGAPASLQWKTSWTVIHSHLIKQLGWSFDIADLRHGVWFA